MEESALGVKMRWLWFRKKGGRGPALEKGYIWKINIILVGYGPFVYTETLVISGC